MNSNNYHFELSFEIQVAKVVRATDGQKNGSAKESIFADSLLYLLC